MVCLFLELSFCYGEESNQPAPVLKKDVELEKEDKKDEDRLTPEERGEKKEEKQVVEEEKILQKEKNGKEKISKKEEEVKEEEEKIDEDEILLKKSAQIEKEIDAILEEAHRLSSEIPSQEAPSTLPLATRVITPEEVAKDLLSPQKRESKMNLEFEKANLEDVLRTIGEAGEFNIVLDPALKGKKVDIHLRNVSIEEALNLLYRAYDLGSYQIGSCLFVSTREKIRAGALITKIVKLENISVEEAKGLIKKLVEIINLSKETNTLVIVGVPEDVAKAEKILREVDIPQRQVILEAKIVEVDKEALRELGIDWSDSITATFQESKRPVELASPEVAVGSPFKIYRVARSALQFETILKMLENENKAKVLSTPRITTLNNKEAEIFIGDQIPYTVTTVTGGVVTTEVRFVEPGIRLKITPSIIEQDFVVIKVEPEVSSIYGWRGPNEEYPWVKTREATAYVRVKNGQPFVLGGLLTKEDRKNIYKIPFLGDLPFLGALFKYEKHSVGDSELIITVVPTIVSGEN